MRSDRSTFNPQFWWVNKHSLRGTTTYSLMPEMCLISLRIQINGLNKGSSYLPSSYVVGMHGVCGVIDVTWWRYTPIWCWYRSVFVPTWLRRGLWVLDALSGVSLMCSLYAESEIPYFWMCVQVWCYYK